MELTPKPKTRSLSPPKALARATRGPAAITTIERRQRTSELARLPTKGTQAESSCALKRPERTKPPGSKRARATCDCTLLLKAPAEIGPGLPLAAPAKGRMTLPAQGTSGSGNGDNRAHRPKASTSKSASAMAISTEGRRGSGPPKNPQLTGRPAWVLRLPASKKMPGGVGLLPIAVLPKLRLVPRTVRPQGDLKPAIGAPSPLMRQARARVGGTLKLARHATQIREMVCGGEAP